MPKIHVLENGFQNLFDFTLSILILELWRKRSAAKNIKREKPARAAPFRDKWFLQWFD
jgi:hypothetical protein